MALVDHLHHLCRVHLVDPFLLVALCLLWDPSALQLPHLIDMLLGMKLLRAATKSVYPQS